MTNNSILKILLVAVPAAALTALLAVLVVQPDAAQAQRAPARLQPYVIHTGQNMEGFEAFYIVDPEVQQIACLGWDRGDDKLEAVGRRSLAKDFNIKTPTSFSVAPAQLSKSTGLLLVINHTMQRGIVYEIDINQREFRPRETINLAKVFPKR